MDFAIMDNKGIIEDFCNLDDAINNIDRVRKDNDDIEGDLKVIEIHCMIINFYLWIRKAGISNKFLITLHLFNYKKLFKI